MDFDALVMKHRREIFKHAYSLTRNRVDAEDLTQSAFVRAWQAWRTFGTTKSFPAWVNKIVSNLFLDSLRNPRYRLIKTVPLDNPVHGDVCYEPLDPRDDYETFLLREDLKERLSQIPEANLEALTLRAKGLTYEEIAELKGVNADTVKTRVHRARHSKVWSAV